MQIKHIFSTILLLSATASYANNQKQAIDIVNDCDQSLHISAKNANNTFSITQTVPAHTKAMIIAQLVNLKSAQNLLLEAIVNDSIKGIQEAIRLGANINQEVGGRRPLVFAIELEKINAVKYLITCGAA